MIGCEDHLWNDLYCVEWGVKLYSNQSVSAVQSPLQMSAARCCIVLCPVVHWWGCFATVCNGVGHIKSSFVLSPTGTEMGDHSRVYAILVCNGVTSHCTDQGRWHFCAAKEVTGLTSHWPCVWFPCMTNTHPFNGHLSGTRKVKPSWILLKQETVSVSGISWAICKSAPRSRQITTPAPHHSVFYSSDALPAAQPTASKHWRQIPVDDCVVYPSAGSEASERKMSTSPLPLWKYVIFFREDTFSLSSWL